MDRDLPAPRENKKTAQCKKFANDLGRISSRYGKHVSRFLVGYFAREVIDSQIDLTEVSRWIDSVTEVLKHLG